MLSKLKILALLLLVGLLATALPMVMTPDTTSADSTGLTSPTADGASGGDGFEVTPSNAYANDGLTAQNIDGIGDSHLYYNYGFNIPTGATIEGIEVRLDWYLDSDNGTNGMSVDLSWNGGVNWTTAQTDYVEATTEHTAILGGPTATWNRAWNPGEFSNANFRVRVTCDSDDPARDFYLDWVPVSIDYAPVAWFEVTGNSSMTAGGTNQLTITAKDNEGNVAVNYDGAKILVFSGPGTAPGGQLPTIGGVPVGNNISLTFADGVSVAALVAYRAETPTVNVTDGDINSTGYGLTLTVSPATTSQLDLTPEGGPAASGIPFNVIVTAQDAYLNVATGYAGTVRFESTDSGATLPPNYPFTAGDNGIHTFTNEVTLVTSGNQIVTVTDTVSSGLTDSETWSVGAAAASRLEVTGAATMTAGSTNELTITARDASGNVDTTYSGPKSLIFSGPGIAPGGQVPTIGGLDIGGTISVNFTSGVSDAFATTLIAYRAEITTIDVSDGIINSTGYGLVLTVNLATTSQLDLTPDGEPATSGTPFTVMVTATDAYSNVATGYTGTVTFSSSDNATGVVLPGPYTFAASDNGTHTFTDGVTLVTAGDQTLTAADGLLSDTTTWNVGASAAVHHIVISPATAAIIAGDNVTYTVEAFDMFNNSLGDVTSGTTLSIDPLAGGGWSGTDNNVYTSQNAGGWIVTGDYAGIVGTASLTVQTGSAYSIVITPDNPTIPAGSNVTYTAEAFDQSNNSLGDVTTSTIFSIDPLAGGGWTNNVYTSRYAGTWTVTGNYSGITDTDLLTVNAGTAISIVIIPDTATITAGESITYTVEAIDQFNNRISDATATTIFSIDLEAGGSWSANVYASQLAGTWTVTGDCDSIIGTASLTVNPGPIAHYTVTSDNYTQQTSIAFTVTVSAYDAYDNMVTTDNSTAVTMDSSSPTMIFDGNDNGLFGEPGDNVKTLSAGTFDIQAKDNATAEDVTITASVGGTAVEVSSPYTIESFRCFIATAAYGTPMAEEIQILRDFRDKYLSTNPPGRLFVSLYYKLSPPIARFIAQHDSLRAAIRFGLTPVLWLATVALKTTLAQKLAILAILPAAALISIIWLRRTRKNRLA